MTSSRRPGHDRRAAVPAPGFTPASLTGLIVYDDATRTAAYNTGVTSESLSALTVMGWVNPSSTAGFKGVIVGRGDAGAEHWRTDQNGAELRMIENGANFGTKAAAVSAGAWSFFASRYEGAGVGNAGRLRLWMGSTEGAFTSYSSPIPAALTSRAGKTWRIGSFSDGSSGYSAFGSIAQVAICLAALTPAEIAAFYNYTLTRR